MKYLNNYIQEKLKITSNTKIQSKEYKYHPEDGRELEKIIEKLIAENGSDADLNDIDISKIQYLDYLFCEINYSYKIGNIDISEWDVSNVLNMEGMFLNCESFNCDLSNWNVSKVNNMYCMFQNCKNFTGYGLDKWKLKKDCDINEIFKGCDNLSNIKLNKCL